MALVSCPECGTEVSSLAAACPKCAAPIASLTTAKATGSPVITTELTSKRLKVQQAIGAGMLILGMVLLIWDRPAVAGAGIGMGFIAALGAAMVVFGLGMFIVAKIRAWWHHG